MDHAPAPHRTPYSVDRCGRYDLPPSGFRNDWFWTIEAGRGRRKPGIVKLLDDDIVLFRDDGAVHGLADRCPHRGAKLSIGRCRFAGSGTIAVGWRKFTVANSRRPAEPDAPAQWDA